MSENLTAASAHSGPASSSEWTTVGNDEADDEDRTRGVSRRPWSRVGAERQPAFWNRNVLAQDCAEFFSGPPRRRARTADGSR
jgi:hypothetical protein